jgi:hypothetical protein
MNDRVQSTALWLRNHKEYLDRLAKNGKGGRARRDGTGTGRDRNPE